MLEDNYLRQMCVCVCVCKPNSNTIKITFEFMWTYVGRNDFVPVSTILPLDIAAVVTV